MKNKKILIGMALTTSLFIAAPTFAGESTAGTKIGILTCNVIPDTGYNLLIHSVQDITCTYDATDKSSTEHYIGETGVGLGIDFQYDEARQLVFAVFATDTKQGSYKLTGKYIGAGASASVGVGVGAQVLVGGGDKSISLQPVIEASKGVGATAGVKYLYLQKK